MTDHQTPEILEISHESEVLYQRICNGVDRLTPHVFKSEFVPEPQVTSFIVASILGHLRILSARQLAVLLAEPADRKSGCTIHEPPRYSAEEIENVR